MWFLTLSHYAMKSQINVNFHCPIFDSFICIIKICFLSYWFSIGCVIGKDFPLFIGFHFTGLWWRNFLNFIRFHLSIVGVNSSVNGFLVWNLLPLPVCLVVITTCSSDSFRVSCFELRSLIHLDWFLYCVRHHWDEMQNSDLYLDNYSCPIFNNDAKEEWKHLQQMVLRNQSFDGL